MRILVILLFTLGSFCNLSAQDYIDFTATDINGVTHSISDALSQNQIVVLDFFYIDCLPCVAAMQEFQSMLVDYEGKNVVIFSISPVDNASEIESFADSHSFTQYFFSATEGGLDIINEYNHTFGVAGFPTVSIICPTGRIHYDIWPYSNGAPEWRNLIEGCGLQSSEGYFPSPVTSTLENFEDAIDLTVSPNPSTGLINLKLELNTLSKIDYRIIDLTGKVLESGPVLHQEFQVHLEHKGLLLLEVLEEQRVVGRKKLMLY